MSKSMYALGSALLGAMALASTPVSASCSSDTDGVWECLEAREIATGNYVDLTDGNWHGPFHFHGPANLSHDIIGNIAGCTLHVDGRVRMRNAGDPSTSVVDIEVVGARSTGPGNCPSVTFTGFPWTTSVPGNGTPGDVYPADTGFTIGDLSGVTIRYPLFGFVTTVCSGTLDDIQFGNDHDHGSTPNNRTDESYFDFDGQIDGTLLGDCQVQGRVIVDLHHDDDYSNVYDDVNAF